jgi:hypothetical protein
MRLQIALQHFLYGVLTVRRHRLELDLLEVGDL